MGYTIKNQNFVKAGIKNDCILYSVSTILELQYGPVIPYKMVEGLVSNALFNKVLSLLGGTFSIMYPWMARKASKATGLNIIVDKNNINTFNFERSIDEGTYYGIGLLKANGTYIKAIEKGELRILDMIAISESTKKAGHNHVFGKSLDGNGTSIFEIARGKEIKCHIATLRYGAGLGVFRSPARSFIGGDDYSKLVLKYLQQINHKRLVVTPEFTDAVTEEEKKALNHASELNKEFYIKTDYLPNKTS